MSKWNVSLNYVATQTIVVEAETKEEAEQKAYENAYACLCHKCADEFELSDDPKIGACRQDDE